MKAGGPLSRIRVVLLRPSHPGNIGAAARAMKTMGITQLRLVRPKRFPHPDAAAMASGALDLLESARACASLEEALAGTTYSVALSARERELSHPSLDARAAAREAICTRATLASSWIACAVCSQRRGWRRWRSTFCAACSWPGTTGVRPGNS